MDDRHQQIIDRLAQICEKARSSFAGLSKEQLNWRPDEKSWSVAQCLDHLVVTHSLYFPLFKKLESGDVKPTFWENASPLSGFFGRYLIKSLDPANLKKIKTTAKALPSSSEIGGDIVDRFCDHQRQIIEHLQKIPAKIDPAKTIITSPLLGIVTYSLDDCYSILVVHCQRHLAQARRVTENDGFPQK